MSEPTALQETELPSAVCQEAFPAHSTFPQLKVASEPGLMIEVFRKHLKPVSGRSYHIEDCIPDRFRWRKDGSRCVLQYVLPLVESGSGRHSNPWVTGVIYAEPGRAEQVWAELKAAHPLRRIPDSLLTFEPLGFIPELQMLVQVFPYDQRLPGLPHILSGPSPELHRRLLDCFGPGRWRIAERTVEPVRYRTELAAVVRYTLRARNAVTSRTQTKRFYVKVYRGRQGEQTCQLLQQLCGDAGAARKNFTVVQPIVYCSERRCLVLEEAPGRSLQEVFLSGADAMAAARRVARAVAAFNQSDIPAIRRHSAEEQISFLTLSATLLRWACPRSVVLIDEIVNEVRARLEEVPCAPIHWDLKTDHVFLNDERVIFVDLDTVALGDPVRDPAHLLAHIVCRIGLPAMPAEQARAAAGAFVEEYFAHVPARWRERLAVQYAIAVLESAVGIFKRQEPQWPDKVSAAIEEAQQAFSGGFR